MGTDTQTTQMPTTMPLFLESVTGSLRLANDAAITIAIEMDQIQTPSLLLCGVVDDPRRRLPNGAVVEGGHRFPDGGGPV